MNRLLQLIATVLPCLPCGMLHAGPAAGTDKSPARAARSGGWRFHAGFLHRSSGDFDWTTGTMSTPALLTIGLGQFYPGIAAIGPSVAYADRTYNDGFVRQDAGTAADGDTWNWGYDNASQLGGQLLSYHGGDGRRADFSQSHDYEAGGWSGELDGNAPFIELVWLQPHGEAWSFGWQGGLSFLSTEAGRNLSTFTANNGRTDYAISYMDVFDLGTVIAPMAPYAGSLQGSGPLLPNLPVSRTPADTVIGGETISAFNSIRTDFDLNLATLSLGPVMEYARGPWAVTASTGLTLNFANWDASQRETLFVSRNGGPVTAQNNWSHSRDGTEVLAGLFLQAAASRAITENWSLQLIGRYDWVDDFAVSAGPSTGSVDLSGWSLGMALGFRF